jgi:hypothetical protein
MFRSLKDCGNFYEEFRRMEITLHIVNFHGMQVDLGTPIGRALLQMMACFAELEKSMISERTGDTVTMLKAQGTSGRTTAPRLQARPGDSQWREDSHSRARPQRAVGHGKDRDLPWLPQEPGQRLADRILQHEGRPPRSRTSKKGRAAQAGLSSSRRE